MIYHYFIYLDSMLDNLILNKLISKEQKYRIMIHYNFLSSFAHPSKNSIRLWEMSGQGVVGRYDYNEEILKHLIVLYVTKLMQLYIKAVVHGYRRDYNVATSAKYDKVIEELDLISSDLWFFDNEPNEYDKWWSDLRKHAAKLHGRTITNQGTLYYEDPYHRQKEIWKRDHPDVFIQ